MYLKDDKYVQNLVFDVYKKCTMFMNKMYCVLKEGNIKIKKEIKKKSMKTAKGK